jgi:putative Ca2+/H+ antiporter (TMEM165/GDT1 family)
LGPLAQSFGLVAISEIGDKTQLLSLLLVLRFKKPWTIMLAIFVATILNHLGATWFGAVLSGFVPELWLRYGLAATFFIFGCWVLIPDKLDAEDQSRRFGAFLTTLFVFFLAEMGDKTQLATVALGAQHNDVLMVTIGSTLGMMAANALSVFGGERLMNVLPLNYIRYGASALFFLFGFIILPVW